MDLVLSLVVHMVPDPEVLLAVGAVSRSLRRDTEMAWPTARRVFPMPPVAEEEVRISAADAVRQFKIGYDDMACLVKIQPSWLYNACYRARDVEMLALMKHGGPRGLRRVVRRKIIPIKAAREAQWKIHTDCFQKVTGTPPSGYALSYAAKYVREGRGLEAAKKWLVYCEDEWRREQRVRERTRQLARALRAAGLPFPVHNLAAREYVQWGRWTLEDVVARIVAES